MTPNRAATLFRELLQTADAELNQFARRAGLHGPFHPADLGRSRELLEALATALESNRRRDWDRVAAAWQGMRAKHAPPPATGAAVPGGGYGAEPQKPGWVREAEPVKPSLGEPAPGSTSPARPARGKFIPVARPRPIVGPTAPVGAGAPPPAAEGAPPASAVPASATSDPAASPPPGPLSGGGAAADDGRPPLPAAPALLAPVSADPSQPARPPTPDGFTVTPRGVAPAAAPPGQPSSEPADPGMDLSAAQPSPAPASAAADSSSPAPPQRPSRSSSPASQGPAGAGEVDGAGSIRQSVAKYAAFCAACAESPERTADTMLGYGIGGETERSQIDELWQDRFDDDPELLARWEQLFAHFRGSLRQRR